MYALDWLKVKSVLMSQIKMEMDSPDNVLTSLTYLNPKRARCKCISHFWSPAKGGNLIRNRRKLTNFSSEHSMDDTCLQKAAAISLIPCRGFDQRFFVYNIFVKFHGWLNKVIRILHGDAV